MAAPAPPPGAAPIGVVVAAAPLTPELHATLSANEPLVLATSCLPWDPVAAAAVGTPPQVLISQRAMANAFISRCTLDRSAASLASFQRIHVLTFALSGAAWSRILTELVASGLLAQPITDLASLRVAVRALVIATPANLVIHGINDIILGEDFDTPGVPGVPGAAGIPAVAAVRAVGRRGQPGYRPAVPAVPAAPPVLGIPAIPAVPGPAELAVLTYLTIDVLHTPNSTAPLEALSQLIRLCGDCLTRASRLSPTALARLSINVLRLNCERRIFGAIGTASDAAVAMQLPEFLAALRLPPLLQRDALLKDAVQRDVTDTIRYCYGSAEDRRAVETSRLHSISAVPVTHAHFIAGVSDPAQARGLIDRLLALLLTRSQLQLPFCDQLEHLETALGDRQALLGVDPATDLQALIEEERDNSGGAATGSAADSADTTSRCPVADDAFRLATAMPGFRNLTTAMAALDLTTMSGQVSALDAAFSSRSALVFRLLVHGEKALARRHSTLASLLTCRGAMGEYFGRGLSIDPATGQRPDRLATYSFTGPTNTEGVLLKSLLTGKFLGHNWYHDQGGVYEFKAKKFGTLYTTVAPEDYWCIPQCITDLCAHLHLLMVLSGWPATVTQGFTFETWGTFYNNHLRRCTQLSSLDEQYRWLEHASEQFQSFLVLAGNVIGAVASMPRPTEGVQAALAPGDCSPAEALHRKQTMLEEYTAHRDTWHWLTPGGVASVDPEHLPRLSNKGKARSTKAPQSKAERRAADRAKREAEGRNSAERRGATAEKGTDEPNRYVWLSPKASADPKLLIGGKVWSVKGLAAKYGVTAAAKCWEVILSRREGDHAMKDCPCPHATGHKTMTDPAHVLRGFKIGEAAAEFARDPTADERKKIPYQPKQHAGQRSKGRSKGTRAGSSFRQPPGK